MPSCCWTRPARHSGPGRWPRRTCAVNATRRASGSRTPGDRIVCGFALWGKRPALFSLPDLTLKPAPDEAQRSGLARSDEGPREGLSVTDWEDGYDPKLAGKPLALEEFERARGLALDPERRRFVRGTEWSLRAYDAAVRSGRPSRSRASFGR